MKKRILLTGASGTVGREVLKQLLDLKDRFDVSVFDLKTPKSIRLFSSFGNGFHVFYGDISDPNGTIEAVRNQDAVIHLAALIPPAADVNKPLAEKINVYGTLHLVNNLEKFSPNAFFVYSSSVAVYGDRLENSQIRVTDKLKPSMGDYYAETKIRAESIIRKSKLQWAIFRLSAIMGAGNHKISGLMFHMPLNTPMEITTPEDTARAFVNSLDKQPELVGKIFNLGGGDKNRILYRNFLQKSFDIYGLGKLNFPEYAFAQKNFHCGYYADGDVLEDILHFRKDTLDTYFKKVKDGITPLQRFFAKLVRTAVKKNLLLKSEPYNAFRKNDTGQLKRYFG